MNAVTTAGVSTPRPTAFYIGVLAALSAIAVLGLVLGFALSTLLIVFGLLAFAALVLAVSAPSYLLPVIPFLMAIEYRVRIGPVSFTFAELAILLVWLTVAVHRSIKRNGLRPSFETEGRWIAVLSLLALPSAIFEPDLKHALSTYRDLMVPLWFLWGFVAMRLRRDEVRSLAKLYVLVAASTAILAIVQFLTGNFLWLQSPENAEWQEFKLNLIHVSPIGSWLGVADTLPVGLYQQTNDFGVYLILPICVAFAWAVAPMGSKMARIFWGVTCLLLVGALILCFFRSGFLTVLMACLFWLGFRKRRISTKRLLWAGGCVAATLGLLLYSGLLAFDEFGTVAGRMELFGDGLRLVVAHPLVVLTGGFSRFFLLAYDQVQLVHNLELYSLIRFGLGATLVLLGLYTFILKRLRLSTDDLGAGDRDFRLLLFTGAAAVML